MGDIQLIDIIVEKNIVRYRFNVSENLKKFFTTNEMFVSYNQDVSDIPESILTIPFVGSIIAMAWLTDSVLWVKEIDESYYRCIKSLKVAYQELYPHYQLKGQFVSAYIKSNKLNNSTLKSKALLLFSGGIDAHTTYIRHKDMNPILCNIQGWLSNPNAVSDAQEADFRDVEKFSELHNNQFVSLIKSNFAILVDANYFSKKIGRKLKGSWWHEFQHSMSFISIGIPVAFSYGIEVILIASSFYLGSHGKCASYPTTDNEFKYADSGRAVHDGFELNRQDKVGIIVHHQKETSRPYLIRVCSFNDHNCCVCPKCFRSIMGIIAEGGDIEDFGFYIPGNKVEFYKNYIKNHYIEFGINREAKYHWPDIRKRISENRDKIKDQELVEWFLKTNFVKDRKKAVLKYRITNFPRLFLSKIKNILS